MDEICISCFLFMMLYCMVHTVSFSTHTFRSSVFEHFEKGSTWTRASFAYQSK
jgi:hypothetical protein